MKVKQINNWVERARYHNEIKTKYEDKIVLEMQKYCDFEIKFCHYQPSDGYVLVYDNDEFTNVDLSVGRAIELYTKLKRKIKLSDLKNII